MKSIPCNRCGKILPEGSLKYEVAVHVRSVFDGVIPGGKSDETGNELARILRELESYSEEELNRQVYEDDIFIMCAECKEAFMKSIYAHVNQKMLPDDGRTHSVN